MVLMMARREAGQREQRPNSRATLSQAKTKGNYYIKNFSKNKFTHGKTYPKNAVPRVHSGQMVLVVVRQEAGQVGQWPKTLKWEF
jgi:hypothetical protein